MKYRTFARPWNERSVPHVGAIDECLACDRQSGLSRSFSKCTPWKRQHDKRVIDLPDPCHELICQLDIDD